MENNILSKVGNVRRQIIEDNYGWGLYVYKKANGKWFTDGEGNVLNIPSMKNDISKITELTNAAKYYGDPGDGFCVFVPGLTRVSDETHSEQLDRMKQGLIPSMNDLGAWKDAQKTVDVYGQEALEYDE
jgi:hypothetical protein